MMYAGKLSLPMTVRLLAKSIMKHITLDYCISELQYETLLSFQRGANDTCANHMLIRIGYDIALRLPFATTVLYVLHIHPSRTGDLVGSEDFRIGGSTPEHGSSSVHRISPS